MKRPKIEIFHARDGWRWHLKAANGRILCSGEGHTRRADAVRAVRTVRDSFNRALMPGETSKGTRPVTDSSNFASPNGHNFNALPN